MTVRGAALFVGACLLLIAVLLAVIPFSRPLSGINVALDCDPPVAAAWASGERDQLSLWAVTVGTNMSGENDHVHIVGDVGPWCRAPARQRLLVSGVLVVVAAGVAIAGRALTRRPTEVVVPSP